MSNQNEQNSGEKLYIFQCIEDQVGVAGPDQGTIIPNQFRGAKQSFLTFMTSQAGYIAGNDAGRLFGTACCSGGHHPY